MLSIYYVAMTHVASIEGFTPARVIVTKAFNNLGKISRSSFAKRSRFILSNYVSNAKRPLFGILPTEYDDESYENLMLAEKMTLDDDKTAKLARLAVAFSPPQLKLTMDHLDSVQVVCLDEHHIEISAVMCEEECVSVLVPLTFPHSCDVNGDMEECVLENVEELNAVAEVQISEMKNGSEEGNCDENDDFSLHAPYVPYNFPDWWVKPSDDTLGISFSNSVDLDDECENIARLLNEEEFREDMVSLATQGLFESIGVDGYDYEIQKAIVSWVGPLGVCLRAKARKNAKDSSRIIDIPIPFGREPAKDRNELRAAVLGAVAAVHIE